MWKVTGVRQGAGRELNLTWQAEVPSANRVVAGRWWDEQSVAEVSVESRIADRLDIVLGDSLQFMIGGETLTATVSSLREVDWNTMQPNFYMIFSPGALSGFPASYIGSFYLPADKKPLLNTLLAAHPTVSVLEVDTIIRQVQSVIDQVSVALQYIMLLVVGAALLVLFAQTQASFEERRQEMVILRTLGASADFIRRTIQNEFLLLGLLAGVLAGWASELTLFLIQTQVLEMSWRPHWWLWLLAGVSGAVFVGLAGRLACRSLLQQSALKQIRQLG
jgi:putative ABC transport system permease protein